MADVVIDGAELATQKERGSGSVQAPQSQEPAHIHLKEGVPVGEGVTVLVGVACNLSVVFSDFSFPGSFFPRSCQPKPLYQGPDPSPPTKIDCDITVTGVKVGVIVNVAEIVGVCVIVRV